MAAKLLFENQNYLSAEFVFIDFSLPHLRLLMDLQWLERLAASGIHVVLLVDRSLAPLANYWLTQCADIRGVIYSDESAHEQRQKFHRLFTGRRANSKRGRSLNSTEILLLKRFLAGEGLQQIIQSEDMAVKKIYAYKLRLENKLGKSIHQIMSAIL